MTSIMKIIISFSFFVLVQSEPPVQGYHYEPNNFNLNPYSVPSNTYLPPKTGLNLPSSYLPPNSFAPSNIDQSQHGHNGHHGHHGHGGHGGHDNEVPKSYEFGYSVKDAKSGNDYDRREVSDGNVVRGEYRVQLPDGRTQIVSYHADWQTGFHADVRYEGEARYPDANNQGYNYNAPEYSGSLNGFHNGNGFKPAYGPPGYH